MSNWIKCSDKSPPFHKNVIVTDGRIVSIGAYYGSSGMTDWVIPAAFMGIITHWQELPALPEEE